MSMRSRRSSSMPSAPLPVHRVEMPSPLSSAASDCAAERLSSMIRTVSESDKGILGRWGGEEEVEARAGRFTEQEPYRTPVGLGGAPDDGETEPRPRGPTCHEGLEEAIGERAGNPRAVVAHRDAHLGAFAMHLDHHARARSPPPRWPGTRSRRGWPRRARPAGDPGGSGAHRRWRRHRAARSATPRASGPARPPGARRCRRPRARRRPAGRGPGTCRPRAAGPSSRRAPSPRRQRGSRRPLRGRAGAGAGPARGWGFAPRARASTRARR